MSDQSTADVVQEFRDGLARGELLLQTCDACRKLNMYPRYRCPFCQSDDLGWTAAEGGGTLHSFTVVRAVPPRGFEDELPYALGVVKLDEGVQLLGRLVPSADGDWRAYACDVAVRFAPRSAEEVERQPVAWFSLRPPKGAER